jgi:hypothetical protein
MATTGRSIRESNRWLRRTMHSLDLSAVRSHRVVVVRQQPLGTPPSAPVRPEMEEHENTGNGQSLCVTQAAVQEPR